MLALCLNNNARQAEWELNHTGKAKQIYMLLRIIIKQILLHHTIAGRYTTHVPTCSHSLDPQTPSTVFSTDGISGYFRCCTVHFPDPIWWCWALPFPSQRCRCETSLLWRWYLSCKIIHGWNIILLLIFVPCSLYEITVQQPRLTAGVLYPKSRYSCSELP